MYSPTSLTTLHVWICTCEPSNLEPKEGDGQKNKGELVAKGCEKPSKAVIKAFLLVVRQEYQMSDVAGNSR